MADEIDTGAIIKQVRIPIDVNMVMFRPIEKSRGRAGTLIIQSVEQLITGNMENRPDSPEQSSYFSWPTVELMKLFRKHGGRLI